MGATGRVAGGAGGGSGALSSALLAAGAVCAVVLAAAAAAVAGPGVVAVVAAALLVAVCAARPVAATYVYLGTLPFVAGVERSVFPLRPNEILLLLVASGAAVGLCARFAAGAPMRLRLRPAIDGPLLAFLLAATAWPLASLLLRGGAPAAGDLAAVLPACKLALLLVLIRTTVVEVRQLVRCIRIVVWSGAGIAVIAALQVLGVGPVLSLLALMTPSETAAELGQRGSATLGSSLATGDVIIIALVLLVACGVRGVLGGRERLIAGLLLGAGVLAAGQFSTWIAALVAGALLLGRYPQVRRRAPRFAPVGLAAVVVGAPALVARIEGFWEGFGVPRSWLGRWDNLAEFYLPRLFEGAGWLVGVSPDPVLPAPETWREVIYLESGYLQLLWIGGIPLLAAFAWLSVAVLRRARALDRGGDAVGAAGSALRIVWTLLLVLMVIDPHLFLRGTGDLLALLLAVASGPLSDRLRPGHPALASAR